ncbi:hypothetical protein VPH35_131822 [Triticum aestivum]
MRGPAKCNQSMETKYLSNCLQGWLYDLRRLALLCSASGDSVYHCKFLTPAVYHNCYQTLKKENQLYSNLAKLGGYFYSMKIRGWEGMIFMSLSGTIILS